MSRRALTKDMKESLGLPDEQVCTVSILGPRLAAATDEEGRVYIVGDLTAWQCLAVEVEAAIKILKEAGQVSDAGTN